MTHVRQSLITIAILTVLNTTLRMQKYVVNVINIDGQRTCLHFKRARGM